MARRRPIDTFRGWSEGAPDHRKAWWHDAEFAEADSSISKSLQAKKTRKEKSLMAARCMQD